MRPDANSRAVMPLTAMPIAATTITVSPTTGSGAAKRLIASQAIPPIATSRMIALNRAARTVEPRRP